MVFWVFGYSSLVWSPGFEFDDKMVGYIKGYRRVFDVACIDHRGTPERPARVCSLEADEEAVCWGVAYCVKGGEEKQRAAIEYLEKRECEYDLKLHVDFYKEGQDAPAISGVILFTATAKLEYKYYLGPAPFDEMARQIATAVGPCGNNREYLFSLEKALSNIGHEDDYVIELVNEVRKVLTRSREQRMMSSPKHKAPFNQAAAIYHSTSSTAAAAAGGANSHCFPLITTFTPDAAPSLAVESLLS